MCVCVRARVHFEVFECVCLRLCPCLFVAQAHVHRHVVLSGPSDRVESLLERRRVCRLYSVTRPPAPTWGGEGKNTRGGERAAGAAMG